MNLTHEIEYLLCYEDVNTHEKLCFYYIFRFKNNNNNNNNNKNNVS